MGNRLLARQGDIYAAILQTLCDGNVPSVRLVASMCGMTHNMVYRTIVQLQELGLLHKVNNGVGMYTYLPSNVIDRMMIVAREELDSYAELDA